MSQSDSNFDPDMRALLAGYALGDLDAVEFETFSRVLSEADDPDLDEMQRTAGALHLLFASRDIEAMPASLRSKIATEAEQHLSGSAADGMARPVVSRGHTKPISRREQLSWLMTAASVLLAIGLWNSSKRPAVSLNETTTAAEARGELISQAKDHIEVAWTNGSTPFDAEVAGDVVWSNSLQQGFMRFVGMPINDATVEQYQLWIIDPARDDEPIDGGVFDVNSGGEVIIPIHAKLNVIDPAAFAVTIEKPGGVVVSDQKRLPLLAKVSDVKG